MNTFFIQLNTVNDVKDFVSKASKYPFEIDLHSGRHKISAKSLMGVFSLSLDKPIEVEIIDAVDPKAFMEDVSAYVCTTAPSNT